MDAASLPDKKGPTLPDAVGLRRTRSAKRHLWLASRGSWQATAVDVQAPTPTAGSSSSRVHRGHQGGSLHAGRTPQASSVRELLCKRSEDPEEVLYNLGFGKDEPDVTTKIPARYLSSVSQARGINGQVLLMSQLARLSGENPALERRFHQVRTLANVADTFNQIYSQVSGVHVPMLLPPARTRSLFAQQGKDGREEEDCDIVGNVQPSGKTKVARRLIKTLSKHKLFGGTISTMDDNRLTQVTLQCTLPTAKAGQTSSQRPASGTTRAPFTRQSTLAEPSLKTVHVQYGEAVKSGGLNNISLKIDGEEDSRTCRDCRGLDSGRERVTLRESGISKLTSFMGGTDAGRSRACGERTEERSDVVDALHTKLTHGVETPMSSRQPCILRPSAVMHRDKGSPITQDGPQDKPRHKDSFDLEEVLSNDGESCRAGLHSAGVRQCWELPARTGSAHSDSSGYAEDPTIFDCSSAVQQQHGTESLSGADSQGSQGTPLAPSVYPEVLPCESVLPRCDVQPWPDLGAAAPLADKCHRDGERIEPKADPAKSSYEQPGGLHSSTFEDFIGGSQTLPGSPGSLGSALICKVPRRNLFSSRATDERRAACQTVRVPGENDGVNADDECAANAPGVARHRSLREHTKQRSVSTQTDSVDTSNTIGCVVPTACAFSHLRLRSRTMMEMGEGRRSCEFDMPSRGCIPSAQDGTQGHQELVCTSNNCLVVACVCGHRDHHHFRHWHHGRMYPERIDCRDPREPRVLLRSHSLDDLTLSRRRLHYSLTVQV